MKKLVPKCFDVFFAKATITDHVYFSFLYTLFVFMRCFVLAKSEKLFFMKSYIKNGCSISCNIWEGAIIFLFLFYIVNYCK